MAHFQVRLRSHVLSLGSHIEYAADLQIGLCIPSSVRTRSLIRGVLISLETNYIKQIINHFETLDFIRLNFNDNHVSYLFLGQTWCDICCGPGSHRGPTSTSPSHTFWCDIVLHCLSGQCNKSIKRLTMYWNTLLSSNWLWRTVLVLFKHVLYLFAAIL